VVGRRAVVRAGPEPEGGSAPPEDSGGGSSDSDGSGGDDVVDAEFKEV
jgi:hypothetical protein